MSGRDRMAESKSSLVADERVWYDQFTSTDWVHDSIADGYRIKALRARKDFRGRILATFDGAQGWVLAALIGCITALIAYCVDVSEAVIFDFKEGHCRGDWLKSRKVSCLGRQRHTPLTRRRTVVRDMSHVMHGNLGHTNSQPLTRIECGSNMLPM